MIGMGNSSVDFFLFVWVEGDESNIPLIAKGNYLKLIYKTLNENNITIPFPQTDLHIKDSIPLGKVAYFVSMTFIVIVAVEQLQLNIDIITNNLTIIIGTICLLIAIAGGFAVKGVATNIVSSTYLKNSLKVGDKVELDGVFGEIKEITSTNVVVKTSNGKVYVPSEKVLNNTFTVVK